jgi:ectoine hydroxylase-related dioxygenase (phytanoyl-CoA dioxygenase family)
MLSAEERRRYDEAGHLTVAGVFSIAEIDAALADVEAWGRAVLAELAPSERGWYLDAGVTTAEMLRKLDDPIFHRPALRRLAAQPGLVARVESIIGRGVSVPFSQIFFKPPHGGGPKPVHQDNFYFGPADPERLITAWIALDDATVENGCMEFGEGTHRGPVHAHAAPPGEPFNLRVPPVIAELVAMTPAPVPRGGVSFHHGSVFHQSGDNHSPRWRRACAIHYVANDNPFVSPALAYDAAKIVRIT